MTPKPASRASDSSKIFHSCKGVCSGYQSGYEDGQSKLIGENFKSVIPLEDVKKLCDALELIEGFYRESDYQEADVVEIKSYATEALSTILNKFPQLKESE